MLSVPHRWLSSPAKRDMPSPRARKSSSSDHKNHLTDIHVDPAPTVHADASSDHQTNLNSTQPSTVEEVKSAPHDEGKGQIVDYSI